MWTHVLSIRRVCRAHNMSPTSVVHQRCRVSCPAFTGLLNPTYRLDYVDCAFAFAEYLPYLDGAVDASPV